MYGWVVMSNHVHLLIRSNKENLSDIIRDFKKITSGKIVKAIASNEKESRKSWLLWLFKNGDKVIFWQEGYHGEEIITKSFFETKLKYIHQNPVRAGIVEEYINSSCGDYNGIRKGLLDLHVY